MPTKTDFYNDMTAMQGHPPLPLMRQGYVRYHGVLTAACPLTNLALDQKIATKPALISIWKMALGSPDLAVGDVVIATLMGHYGVSSGFLTAFMGIWDRYPNYDLQTAVRVLKEFYQDDAPPR